MSANTKIKVLAALAEIESLAKDASRGPWQAVQGEEAFKDWPLLFEVARPTKLLGGGSDDKGLWWVATDGVHASELGGSSEGDVKYVAAVNPARMRELIHEIRAILGEAKT